MLISIYEKDIILITHLCNFIINFDFYDYYTL
jgi:hypothetical protein